MHFYYGSQTRIRKAMCDFLLEISTNLHPISHRFQVIADFIQIFAFDRVQRDPVIRNTKFCLKKLERSLCRMALIYLQTIVSFCHNVRV